jgi:hypothetical protein
MSLGTYSEVYNHPENGTDIDFFAKTYRAIALHALLKNDLNV